MKYKNFITFNAIGGALWVFGVSIFGYFFGTMPIIRDNFSIAVIVIVLISIMPAVIEILKSKLKKTNEIA